MPVFHIKVDERESKVLYVHIPKAGGISISNFFKKIGFTEHFGRENAKLFPIMKYPPSHFDYKTICSLFDIEKFDFRFTIVRNPYDRIRSDYRFAMKANPALRDNPVPMNFWINKVFDGYLSNEYFLGHHIKPQHLFVGEKIEKIYKKESGHRAILEDVIENIGGQINQPWDEIIPKANVGDEKYQLEDFDPPTLDRVRDLYRLDFERFGYDISDSSLDSRN